MIKKMSNLKTLNYQLAELPSPQHRAGLAGLVLMIRELHQNSSFCELENVVINIKEKQDSATVEFNLEGLKSLLNLTYQSFKAERFTTTKIKNYERWEEVEITDKNGKTQIEKRYYYSVIVPYGAFLARWSQNRQDEGYSLWIELWRDLLWKIIRGVHTTRNPYKYRCDGQTYSQDALTLWKNLDTPEKAIKQLSNYFLGAMASTAENVPMKDTVRHQFLLHFWVFVTQVYVPATLNQNGQREFGSYALVIPDVNNLLDFCEEFPWVLQQRSSQKHGYLPRQAIIDLPEESALDLLRLMRQRLSRQVGNQSLSDLIWGAQIIQATKPKHTVKIQSISYITGIDEQIDRYTQIKHTYWCPWFRKQRLLNLLHSPFQPNQHSPFQPNQHSPFQPNEAVETPLKELPAWTGFELLLSRLPRRWLEDSYFSHDARELFKQEVNTKMKSSIRNYAQIVYQVCQSYVLGKLSSKYNLKWVECQDNLEKRTQYNRQKFKVANEAFLAVRSRTESEAFIDYFVSTLSPLVSQSEFADFASKLFQDTGEIRALTLLALSSQFPPKGKSDNHGTKT